MKEAGVYVADTSVLVRYLNRESPGHGAILRLLGSIGEADVLLAPQAIYESWVVMTRPENANGFGWSPKDAQRSIVTARKTFRFVPDPLDLVEKWLDLCSTHGASGKPAHDARLAAYAIAVGADGILTLNPGDFKRYGITVLVP